MLWMASGRDLTGALIWTAVCFVSILIHELGHVLAFRFFGRPAEVVLDGFGGLAIPYGEVFGTVPNVFVSFAGPLAGFCVAGLTAAVIAATGGHLYFGVDRFQPYLSASVDYRWILWSHIDIRAGVSLLSGATRLVNDLLLYVNFFWGLINLLPVWPLDGGHISRALLERWDRVDGRRKSLIVSALVASAIALAGLADRNMWRAVFFGVLAVGSLQALAGMRRRAIPVYRRYRE